MDGPRFDALARAAAAPGSRRRLLAGLAAAAVGLAGGDRARAVACRTPGELCRGNDDCCARLCARDATGRHVCRCGSATDCPPPTNKCLAATCAGGVCGTAVGVVCAAIDQCHLPGTCLPATGTCTNPAKQDGAACDDGDQCTRTDTCQAGVCVGGNRVVCPTPDQCHTAGACDPRTGLCSNPNATDGTACDDGNKCTRTDTCRNGVCVGSNPVACMAQDQCHVAGICDPKTGACSNPTKGNGTRCDDGNACTSGETCTAGVCGGGTPVADGTACNDGNACTQTDTCRNGVCVGSNPVVCPAPADACHVQGACDPVTGVCTNPTQPDGTACGTGGACVDGRCFLAYPNCGGCGRGGYGIAANGNGVTVCGTGNARQDCAGQTCTHTSDCPAGQFCEVILCGDGQNHCAGACSA
jgi:hypothetical protein